MKKLYYYNEDALEYEEINLKPLLLFIPILAFCFFFRWFYFDARIFEITDYKGNIEKVTPQEKFRDVQRIASYD